LQDQWGIVRLHRRAAGKYELKLRLPIGQTTFAYIRGTGVTSSRQGRVPGNPVVTIAEIPRKSTATVLPLVVWQAPIG
jgi:hypothetical protein